MGMSWRSRGCGSDGVSVFRRERRGQGANFTRAGDVVRDKAPPLESAEPTYRNSCMGVQDHPPLYDAHDEVVAFLKGRSAPCPRCGYDLRDIQRATCPECGEALVLKVGSPQARFGWLVLAMAPGCFSGVAAVFVMFPITASLWNGSRIGGKGLPWPILGADAFGFLSAASVALMYRHRHRIMAWTTRRQAAFAGGIWIAHVVALGLFILAMWLLA